MTTAHDIRSKMQRGEATIGTWMQLPSTDVAEILGRAGYDWVAVDLEHAAFTRAMLPDLFRAIELGGTAPFARVAEATLTDIKAALDSGAHGIIFPMIETREQLDAAIGWALYPRTDGPSGIRGVGYCRGNLFGREFDAYRNTTARDLVFVAQIEHIRAVENLDAILAHPRLDAIMVGPYDLSGSMGLTAQFDHPDFKAALDRIRDKAVAHGVPMGLHIVQPDEALVRAKVAEGYRFIAYGIDAVFLYHGAQCPAPTAERK
ncbi:HpcH/HpaI aldolase family protein [Nitratidesulfovibrio vulgaris]|jgi:2-dehydro-3-deoxyglucarate aldolase|uniref:HPCH/HPAI aldolase family protein n=2 Tax=Nitratidesulfovibrio vulgaris TaxID=881 RepID=Q72F71_NITV2|nr:aldolase/citrate lyase family protein [Nitratidesulfovibrio vulgaris]GEB80118.1 2,4-dihydroxyhept-2-ene-1,7-dioic acid aldolase [Desulfovibrio desulfuricans]HBW17418.1 2,4-dihydroxyhept-2-ene-1,7-dioic acid aldolase [Desulfovibrio sp.]AAS94826.1 HPCH/HPAI aldolase family protein [Nitratidesulfovibrio vulgaris str. Hildenborough]ABM29652.1 2-dehydro-3-deoxyglucarate aldolase [Nitratidesulfovibrio vulgaris DP4]ADP85481.1 HpcH/HpaI aldolase [Nitratidesulfovibrio vulgaris RCH1]